MERREWTQADLPRLHEAITTLQDLDVLSVALRDDDAPECHIDRRVLAQVAALTGARPPVQLHGARQFWEASIEIMGCRMYGLFSGDELPLIGYRATPIPARAASVPEPTPLEEASSC